MNISDLITAARTFHDRGFEIVASREKIPVHPWKNDPHDGSLIPREKLYAMAMRQIESGRADSISLRLNADLAAIDLDFYSPDLTDEFVDLFDRKIGLPYTTAGKKGCKIFIRLENKDGIERTFRIGNTLYPDDGSGAKNDLEVKCELSAVFGRHSDGIEYHAYPGGFPGIWQLGSIDDLPVMPEWQIEKLLNEAAQNTGHVESKNVVSVDDIARAYFCAAMALRKDPDAPVHDLENDISRAKTVIRFLDYFAYDFPAVFVSHICGIAHGTRWPCLVERMAADFANNADFFTAFVFGGNSEYVDWKGKQLFRPAHDVIIESLMIDGFFIDDGGNTSIFDLFERFERIAR